MMEMEYEKAGFYRISRPLMEYHYPDRDSLLYLLDCKQ